MDSIPEDEKPFQRRLMEVAAGYAEHVDVQVGRVIDEIERLGYGDDTLYLLYLGRQRVLGGRPERDYQRVVGAERWS